MSHKRWLLAQLPELVSQGVLAEDAAERLRRHYAETDEGRWRQIILTVCGVLGVLLIGLGIVFLLAYNWSALSRPVRAAIAVAPLAASQVLAGWVIWSGRAAAAWREGAALLVAMALAAAIALVQQTYHVAGAYDEFLLPWMILVLPLVYLAGSSVVAVLYLLALLVWAESSHLRGPEVLYVVLLGSALVPHVVLAARPDRYALRPVFLMWAATIWAGPALAVVIHEAVWPVEYTAAATLPAIVYMAGCLWFDGGASVWRRPFLLLGAVGAAAVAFVSSFHDFWRQSQYGWAADDLSKVPWAPMVMACVLAVAWLLLVLAVVVRRRYGVLVAGLLPPIAVGAEVMAYRYEHFLAAAWLFSAYVLAIGVAALATGLRSRRLGLANAGTLLIVALVAARFADSRLGFLIKGIGCIVAGAGFLVTNLVLHRLRRRAEA